MQFDRAAAKQAGYTDEEIDQYLASLSTNVAQQLKTDTSDRTAGFDRAAAKQAGYTDEEINDFLANRPSAKEPSAAGVAAQMAAPATTAVAYNMPSGYNPQAVKQVVEPLKAAVPQTIQAYRAAPWKAGVDLAAGSMGLPPPYAAINTAEAAAKSGAAVKQSFTEGSRLASQFADAADTKKYFDLWQAAKDVSPGVEKTISDIYRTQGGGNAVKNWLTTTEEGKQFLTNPKTAQVAEQYLGALPSKMAQVGRVLKPLAVGAARVAGPVGTAMQVAEAMPYMEQSQIGQRTQSGEVGQLMRGARNMQLNQPTPAQLSPEEAQNLLSSGNQRMINVYGGEDALRSAVRRTAARKIIGLGQ